MTDPTTSPDEPGLVTSSPLDYDDPPRVLTMPKLAGPNVSANTIADAFEYVLRTGLPARLAAYDLPEDLLEPVAYRQQPSIDLLQQADLPAVAIVVGGFSQPPEVSTRGGRRSYRVTWGVTVAFWLRGESWQGTTTADQQWAAAIRATVLTSAPGLAGRWELTNEFYSSAPDDMARTLAAGYVEFDVTVEDAVVPALIGVAAAAPPFTSVAETVTPTSPIPTGE